MATNSVAGEPIHVGAQPVLLFWAAEALWVTNSYSGTVSRIDL